jgi:hypothetical protein
VKHASDGATALLGMPWFVAGAQLELDGEIWLLVETTAETGGLPWVRGESGGHGRRWLRVRDLPMAGRRVVLVWAKPRLRRPTRTVR